MLEETKQIVSENYPVDRQDLFMEQGTAHSGAGVISNSESKPEIMRKKGLLRRFLNLAIQIGKSFQNQTYK